MDDRLWSELRALVARLDPVPPAVLAAARESLAWRDPDAALAALVADSATAAPAGVRGAGPARLLTFEVAGGTTIELEVTPLDRAVHLVGQVITDGGGVLRVEGAGFATPVGVDDLGRFEARCPEAGSLRLRWTPEGGPDVLTEWFLP